MPKSFIWTVLAVLAALALWDVVGSRVTAKLPV